MKASNKALVFNPSTHLGEYLADALRDKGVDVDYIDTTKITVQQAVDKIRQIRPNLAVVALSFNENGRTLEGLELLTQQIGTPVVITHSSPDYEVTARDLGARDYLYGVLSNDEIVRRLLQALGTQ